MQCKQNCHTGDLLVQTDYNTVSTFLTKPDVFPVEVSLICVICMVYSVYYMYTVHLK